MGPLPGRSALAVDRVTRASRRVTLHQQDDHRDAGQRDAGAHDENQVIGLRRRGQQREGDERPEHRADRVQRTVNPEDKPKVTGCGGEGKQCVPRSGPDALTDAVGDQRPGNHRRRRGPDHQNDLRHGRQGIPGGRDVTVPPPTVGCKPAHQPHESAQPLVQTVDQAVLEWSEAQRAHQVERQDRGDHLCRQVGEQTGQAQEQHACADGPTQAVSGSA